VGAEDIAIVPWLNPIAYGNAFALSLQSEAIATRQHCDRFFLRVGSIRLFSSHPTLQKMSQTTARP
jgi:hypothetical protein